MKTLFRNILTIIVLIGLAGCGQAGGDTAQSSQPRDEAPDVPATDEAALVRGNTAFALDLYRALAEEQEGTLFCSPYSISLALAMTYAGARGSTETQMADVLHFTLPQERLHPALGAGDLSLTSQGEDDGFQLNIANALWGQEGYPFLDAFLDTLAVNYGAGMHLLDYTDDPEAARSTINDWVSQQTEGKVEDLIAPGALDAATRLVLANAIYFDADWLTPFEEPLTKPGRFTLLDGSQVWVPLMHQIGGFGYSAGEGYQTIELPYDDGQMSMIILLPDRDQFDAFEQALDPESLDKILAGIAGPEEVVDLTMPSFEFESQFSLAETLMAMGMSDAFSSGADFSGMTGAADLGISDVIHKAFVAVDEEGTEAAAATAVEMTEEGPPPATVVMVVDHPFIFLIRDTETKTILFLGRVMVDPN